MKYLAHYETTTENGNEWLTKEFTSKEQALKFICWYDKKWIEKAE